MLHTTPKKYQKDQKLIDLYNIGFKEGYYETKILDCQTLSEFEEQAYEQGKTQGVERRIEEKGR